LNIEIRQYGQLTCRVVDPPNGAPARRVVVLSHGYGAPGTDLVDLAGWFLDADATIAGSVQFVFPEAPIDLTPAGMPGGRAWWPVNMAQIADFSAAENYEQLTTLKQDGLTDASNQLIEAVRDVQQQSNVVDNGLFLGGFSQGAMVSTDVVLRHGIQPAGLIVMSGMLICRDEWTRLADQHPGCPVIQTHGLMDPVVPYKTATWLRDMLTDSGFTVSFESFAGPHTIPPRALSDVRDAISASLSQNAE